MKSRQVDDPNQARYLRSHQMRSGYDEKEDQEDKIFHDNPLEAINKSSKERIQKNLQKQVEYFGNAIQPFNMREETELGEVDQEGFFVFRRGKRARDAWLDSLDDDEDQTPDKIAKKIKTQSRFKSVYEADDKINEDFNEDEEQDEEEDQRQEESEKREQSEKNEKEEALSAKQIIEIVIQLIPKGKNVNKTMKKLKSQKKMDEYNKLLFLCNEYIAKTGEHEILTKKRQQLKEMAQQEEQGIVEWNMDESKEHPQPKVNPDDDEDNIF